MTDFFEDFEGSSCTARNNISLQTLHSMVTFSSSYGFSALSNKYTEIETSICHERGEEIGKRRQRIEVKRENREKSG